MRTTVGRLRRIIREEFRRSVLGEGSEDKSKDIASALANSKSAIDTVLSGNWDPNDKPSMFKLSAAVLNVKRYLKLLFSYVEGHSRYEHEKGAKSDGSGQAAYNAAEALSSAAAVIEAPEKMNKEQMEDVMSAIEELEPKLAKLESLIKNWLSLKEMYI